MQTGTLTNVIALATAALLSTAALTSCGGGGSDDGPPPPPQGAPPSNPLSGGSGAAAGGYQVEAVANGGKITGTVTWTGGAYSARPLDVTKDVDTCKHPGAVDQTFSVDNASKGVADVVVFITKIDKGKAWGKGGVLDNKGCLFQPHVVLHGVKSGALKISNSDPVNHNTHLVPSKNEDFNKMIASGKSESYGPDLKAEKLPMSVKCDIHGWMEGHVWIVDHPYYELSGKNGSFAISDVPAGSWQLAAWHGGKNAVVKGPSMTVEAGKSATVAIEMAADGTLSWK